MANLFATKSLTSLLAESKESGEHSLQRTLGVFQLTALGVGVRSLAREFLSCPA